MRENRILHLLLIALLGISCSACNQTKDDIPYIDVTKNYPEKEIILTDIADITYVHLNSKNADYVYRGGVKYITENSIVVVDGSSGSVLFFSKDGEPKSRFNHYGQGPEEYPEANFFITYDEKEDDLYVIVPGYTGTSGHRTQVYSSTGKYKRTIILPACPMPLVDFDDQSLFVYDMQYQYKKMIKKETDFSSQLVDSSIYRISKKEGKMLEYVEIPITEVDIVDKGNGYRSVSDYQRIINCEAGLFLCNPETDTVFHYGKDKTLTPIICKTPLVSDLSSKLILTGFWDAGRYQYITMEPLVNYFESNIPAAELYKSLVKYYIRDKQTGEIFRQKISLPDYKGKELIIDSRKTYFDRKVSLTYFALDIFELKQAYKENKLNGKLKELVATLNENKDNNVYILATFK